MQTRHLDLYVCVVYYQDKSYTFFCFFTGSTVLKSTSGKLKWKFCLYLPHCFMPSILKMSKNTVIRHIPFPICVGFSGSKIDKN